MVIGVLWRIWTEYLLLVVLLIFRLQTGQCPLLKFLNAKGMTIGLTTTRLTKSRKHVKYVTVRTKMPRMSSGCHHVNVRVPLNGFIEDVLIVGLWMRRCGSNLSAIRANFHIEGAGILNHCLNGHGLSWIFHTGTFSRFSWTYIRRLRCIAVWCAPQKRAHWEVLFQPCHMCCSGGCLFAPREESSITGAYAGRC